ncbi:MAG: hypothetical protein WCD89_03585 [Anaerocolumna sp.]
MNVSVEVMEKVAEVLKNQTAVDRMNGVTSKSEVYAVASEYIQGVSEEDFFQAIDDIKESNGCIELTETELDSVAGGNQEEKAHVSLSNVSINSY